MKNKFLKIATIVTFAFGGLLASCGDTVTTSINEITTTQVATSSTVVTSQVVTSSVTPTDKNTSTAQQSTPAPTSTVVSTYVPEVGTTTIKMKKAANFIELEEWNSIWMTGTMVGWATGTNAIELKDGIEDGYLIGYANTIWDLDNPPTQDGNATSYQLVVGYASTAMTSEKGLQWNNENYKSINTKAGDGTFTYDSVNHIVDLGEHNFTDQPADPTSIQKTTAQLFVKDINGATVGDDITLCARGSFNGWGASQLTPGVGRKEFFTTLSGLVIGETYEFKIAYGWDWNGGQVNNGENDGNLSFTIEGQSTIVVEADLSNIATAHVKGTVTVTKN